MRHKLFAVIMAFCLSLCSLGLYGCEQENETAAQSASPDITETGIIDDESAPPVSASTNAPSDIGGGETPNNVEQESPLTDVGIHRLETNTEYILDFDGDGVPDTLMLRNNDPQWSCEVLFNGEKINEGDDWTWIGQVHLIRRAGDSVALIYQQDGDDGCNTTSIYTFADGKASKIEYRSNAYSFLTPDSLLLTAPVFYFLGNQFVSIEAVINEDFTLKLGNDGWFTVVTDMQEKEYRAIVDIPMLRLENGEYVDATLAAGTRIYPQLIDESETRMIMKSDDGTLWMYTRDSTGLNVEEGELFDGCTYAGP